jgi:hypothetical protein
MAALTEKENYLKVLRGECPDWVPLWFFGPAPGSTKPVPNHMFEPPVIVQHRIQNRGGLDIWGVNYVPTYEAGLALIPEPNNFILPLDKLTQWRDIIKAPDLSGTDWAAMVDKHVRESGIDRTQTAMALNMHFGFFQTLVSFMGFTDGLMAFYEEPDEVKELLAYLSDFYMDVADHVIDLYKPDILTFMDDTAAWGNPFISPAMYREFLFPYHDQWARRGRERGLFMTMHNCGKSECFADMFVEMGINMWDPAQTCNDLEGIQKKYGNKLVICGGWDGVGRLLDPDVTEEEIRQSVRDTMDRYAVGGGYCWLGNFLATLDDEEGKRKNEILGDEADRYGHAFYK